MRLQLRFHVALVLVGFAVIGSLALLPGNLPETRGQTGGVVVQPPAGGSFKGTCAFTTGELAIAPGAACTFSFLAIQGSGSYKINASGALTLSCPPGAANCRVNSDGSITLTATSTSQNLSVVITQNSPVIAQGSSIEEQASEILASRADDPAFGAAPDDQAVQGSFSISGPSGSLGSVTTAAGVAVMYPAGYNLIGVPTNTVVASAGNPLYTLFRSLDTAYTAVSPTSTLLGGAGYWAYFFSPVTVTLLDVGAQNTTINLPPGRFAQIGNPGTKVVSLSGADEVLNFSPSSNSYVVATTLAPGQGAWAFSRSGGTLTLTATGLSTPSSAP